MIKVVKAAIVAVVLAGMPVIALAQGAGPKVSITSPRNGATVGPKADFKLKIENLKLVDAGTAAQAGEGHAHLLVDKPLPKAGETLPQGDGITHMGKAPYDTRTLDLAPGKHTVVAVLGDSTHKVLSPVASASVELTVSETPTKPANTGDGSLADDGGVSPLLFLGAVVAAIAIVFALKFRRT